MKKKPQKQKRKYVKKQVKKVVKVIKPEPVIETHPTFFNSGDLGDCIAFLPLIRHLGGGHLLLGNHYKSGWDGYYRKIQGEKYDFLKPLLEILPYIKSLNYDEDRLKADYDSSDWRICYRAHRTLTESQAEYFGLQNIDMSPWIKVEPSERTKGMTVIARTNRYHNIQFNWNALLKEQKGKILFIGLPEEFAALRKVTTVPMEFHKCKDMLEMAQLIAGSDLFIGNQSSAGWVAMAMGHPIIQETARQCPDSMVFRDNAKFLMAESVPHKSKHDKKEPDPKLMLALQYYEGDKDQAMELADLLADIQEAKPNDNCEFLLSYHAKASPPPEEIVKKLSKVFTLHVNKGLRLETGHPGGCNALWHDTMHYCTLLNKRHPKRYGGVFTFEGDGVPLYLDWVNRLSQEWYESLGIYALGHVSGPPEHPVTHMNGNAIFPMDITMQLRLTGCVGTLSWDFAHAPKLSKNWKASKLIYNDYAQRNMTEGRLFGEKTRTAIPYCGEKIQPVWVHGVKDDSARKLVREKLLTAVLS